MLPCSMTVRALSSTVVGRSEPSSRKAAIDTPATAANPRPTADPDEGGATAVRSRRLGRRRDRSLGDAVVRARVVGGECHGLLLGG